jgi:predicted DNA-binding protein YlxM (UPF0122 family)
MATETNTAASQDSQTTATATEDTRKLTREGMAAYRTFDSPEAANEYLAKCGTDFRDFADQPFVFKGVDAETGEYDPEIYTDDMRVRVAVLKNRAEEKGKPSTIRAIVIGPVPSLDSMLSDEAGRDFLAKLWDKESNHILVRPLREADDLTTAAEAMPVSRAAFITSQRDTGGAFESYDKHYKLIGDTMAKRSKLWEKAKKLLTKSELRKAFESRGFALEYFSGLEDRGDKPSLFVFALELAKKLAEANGDDPAIFDKWLATRNAQTFDAGTDDDDDLSLDDLTADIVAAEPTAETTEGAAAE